MLIQQIVTYWINKRKKIKKGNKEIILSDNKDKEKLAFLLKKNLLSEGTIRIH